MQDWRNWLLVLVSVLLSMMVAEAFARMFWGAQIVLFPRYQAAVTYGDITIRRLQPEAVFWHTSVDGSWKFTVNERGFRDHRDFSYEKPDGTIRIIALGDSHTQGFEVRQDRTYPAVIERFLDRRGLEAEVINAGISGFGTAEAALFLQHEGLRYAPDAVVLGFYANDFDDNIKSGLFAVGDDGELTLEKKTHAPGTGILRLHNAVPPLRWLSENSYLYSFAMNTIWESMKLALLQEKQQELAVATAQADNYQKQLAEQLLKRMYLLCQENDVLFIVLDIPEPSETAQFASSIPEDLVDAFDRYSDALIQSEEALARYRGVAEFHVPHGQRHISEMSHMLLGVEVAETVQDLLATAGGPPDGGTASLRGASGEGARSDRARP
ncbi:MAG TPA: GDSL-type esterase/lipase family protein [Geminicoccaceae bacterium]